MILLPLPKDAVPKIPYTSRVSASGRLSLLVFPFPNPPLWLRPRPCLSCPCPVPAPAPGPPPGHRHSRPGPRPRLHHKLPPLPALAHARRGSRAARLAVQSTQPLAAQYGVRQDEGQSVRPVGTANVEYGTPVARRWGVLCARDRVGTADGASLHVPLMGLSYTCL